MEKTIKDIEVIAYKGMELDMTCKGFHYELGKSYKTDKAELWKCGFHACLNPLDVLDYFLEEESSRYYKVKLSGEITKCDFDDTEVAATEITILEEITFDELINTPEWWKNDNVLDLLYWSDGLARIRNWEKQYNFIKKQYNFINKQGELLSEQWFNWVGIFHKGFARVRRSDNLYNFINKDGKILSEKWFECVGEFYEGFAIVQKITNSLYNFIDTKGRILSGKWFSDAHSFNDGYAKVKRTNGEWAKIDKNGKISE